MIKCELSSLEYKGDLVLEGLDFNDNLGYLLKFKKINTPSSSYCVDCEVNITIPRKKVVLNAFTYSFVNSTDMPFYDFVESVKVRVLNKFQANVETIQKILDVYTIQNNKKSINIDAVYSKSYVKPEKSSDTVETDDIEQEKGVNLEDIKSLEDLRKAFAPDKMSFDEFMASKGVKFEDIFKFKPDEAEDTEEVEEEHEEQVEEKEEPEFVSFPEFLKMFGFDSGNVKKVESEDFEKALKTGAESFVTAILQGLDKISNEEDIKKPERKAEPEIKVNRHTKPEKTPLEKEGDKMYAWLKKAGYTNTKNEYAFVHYCRQYLLSAGVWDSRVGDYLIRYCLNKFRAE